MVITNLSNKKQTFILKNEIVNGEANNIFSNKKEKLQANKNISLNAWGYLVYEY